MDVENADGQAIVDYVLGHGDAAVFNHYKEHFNVTMIHTVVPLGVNTTLVHWGGYLLLKESDHLPDLAVGNIEQYGLVMTKREGPCLRSFTGAGCYKLTKFGRASR